MRLLCLWRRRRFHDGLIFIVMLGCLHCDTTPIMWEYPFEGICMLDLFGGINTGLATWLQAGIPVWKYLYVERDETTRRVSSHHLALLMR